MVNQWHRSETYCLNSLINNRIFSSLLYPYAQSIASPNLSSVISLVTDESQRFLHVSLLSQPISSKILEDLPAVLIGDVLAVFHLLDGIGEHGRVVFA